MESTTENTPVTAAPAVNPTPAPIPAAPITSTPVAAAPMSAAMPTYPPMQTPMAQQTMAQQPVVQQPMTAPMAQQPVIQQPAPAPQPAPTVAPMAQSAPVAPAPTAQPAPAAQPVVQQPAPAPAPTPQSAPAGTETAQEINTEDGAETEENQEEKKPVKLILNTQRILDDWKYEKGKVLIFLMKLMKVLVVLIAIGGFTMGTLTLLGTNIAIGIFERVAFLDRYAKIAPFILMAATFLTIWVSFANKLTPYFKAFSIAKWLDKNKVDPKEVMKIVLQSRREKELTRYKRGRGGINAEKADLAQAAFILLNEEHKKSYKIEMVWALLFWIFISAVKIAFVFFLCNVIAELCGFIKAIMEQTANFNFTLLIQPVLNPIFLGIIGGWIVLGITAAITLACIAHARNKDQQKWVKAFMKEDMPSKEYYD